MLIPCNRVYLYFKLVLSLGSQDSGGPGTSSRTTAKSIYKLSSLSVELHFQFSGSFLWKILQSDLPRTLIITWHMHSVCLWPVRHYNSKIHLQPQDKNQECGFHASRKQGVTLLFSSACSNLHGPHIPVTLIQLQKSINCLKYDEIFWHVFQMSSECWIDEAHMFFKVFLIPW